MLLSNVISKIAELEKQVQLLASAVNRTQLATTEQVQPTVPVVSTQTPRSYLTGLTGLGAATQSSTWSPSPQQFRGPDVSPQNVDSSFPSMPNALDSISPSNFRQNGLLRARAAVPRSLETLQLSSNQIDDLFQM